MTRYGGLERRENVLIGIGGERPAIRGFGSRIMGLALHMSATEDAPSSRASASRVSGLIGMLPQESCLSGWVHTLPKTQ